MIKIHTINIANIDIKTHGKGLMQTGYGSNIIWRSPRRWKARLHLENGNYIVTQKPMITEFLLPWIRDQMVDFGYDGAIHPEVLPAMERMDAENTAFELKNVKVAATPE